MLSDTLSIVSWRARPRSFVALMSLYESNYLRLRHRADRAGDWAFTLIVITGICVLALIQAPLHAWWLSPMVLANLLIGLLIAKSLVEHVALAFAYRAGHA